MKTIINIYSGFKSRNQRRKSIRLALKSNVEGRDIVIIADKINNYINQGLQSNQ
jgi:hypothetical protein